MLPSSMVVEGGEAVVPDAMKVAAPFRVECVPDLPVLFQAPEASLQQQAAGKRLFSAFEYRSYW